MDSSNPRGGQDAQGGPAAAKELSPEDNTQTIPGLGKDEAPPQAQAKKNEAPWTPPAEFDEFRLQRVIGQGGMGIVYLAQDTSLGRSVAVKFVASREPDPTVLEYFETEARTIARLQHPNIVTVFRVGTVSGHPYIVSEYVVGRSLAQLPRPLPWKQILTLGLGLARGLAAAHRQGILHRDIKPANALVTERGEVKLLDFGLAERVDRSMSLRAAGTKTLAGTPRYMAPELLRGEPATPQSDLYSLGLVLYELCTGSLPPHALAQKMPAAMPDQAPPEAGVLAHEVPPIRPESRVDPDFASLIMRCLAPNPTGRFASTDLLCEALEHLEQPHASANLASNPYRGLAPFLAEHSALFFGRGNDIRALLERLHRQPLVLVVGDPGIGKSSLCRAGVIPRAVTEALNEGRELSTITIWPGRRPLQALASALAPLLDRKEAEIVTALTDTPAWLGQVLRETFQGQRGLLLFIDQLEELITLAEPTQAARFATLLGELALPSTSVRVLLAVRGDFLTSVSALPGLSTEAEQALYILHAMPPEGIREAIVGPARSRGVAFETEGFIQTLVSSSSHGAGSLPLLQFALAELWDQRDQAQGRMTGAILAEMGGVAGALARHADGVLARLTPAELQAARRLLIQLVTTGGMRVVRIEAELVSEPAAASRAALHALVEGRILHAHTEGGKARYELAHDALMVSWGTLRNWLDDDIGHRAIRQRVEAAATEWSRLGHVTEALWGQRQIDETHPLDLSTLTPRARSFLAASKRILKRKRRGRSIAAILLVLIISAVYGGVRLKEYLDNSRKIEVELTKAGEALRQGQSLGEKASTFRTEALKLFDGNPSASSGAKTLSNDNLRAEAEQKWAKALDKLEEVDEAYARATQSLEHVLELRSGHEEAHQLLVKSTYDHMYLVESFYQRSSVEELRKQLTRIEHGSDRSIWQQRLSPLADLELKTDPPDAEVEIERYVSDTPKVLALKAIPPLGKTPILHAQLPAGSYLLHITHHGRVRVDLPLLLTRGGHEQLQLTLPSALPEGYVYIPPGCFLLGTDAPEDVREYMSSAPLHSVCLEKGYLIGKTEVTFGDWLTYLKSLPPNAPPRHFLEQRRFNASGAITLRYEPKSGWVFSFSRSDTDVPIRAREGEHFHYPDRAQQNSPDWRRFPLTGVSFEELEHYFFWLDLTGRLPGARLCTEYEWEHAARGADDRTYPHGDWLQPGDANIDVTYDRQPNSYGPDEVGSHPASASPFGLLDMAGNAYEMTRAVTEDLGRIVLRGGAWYYRSVDARVASRSPGEPKLRDALIGVRVCASFTPGEPR